MTHSHNFKDISGEIFGNLTVISYSYTNKYRKSVWLCKCKCGNTIETVKSNLINGHTLSCGCLRLERLRQKCVRHGMRGTRFYNIWKGIKTRCYNKNRKEYFDYGGRGIKMSDKWLEFNNFKEDMLDLYNKHVEKFGESNTSIDRINVNGNYCKKNCRWATSSEQNSNKRNEMICRIIQKNTEHNL